jgi:hypothetical protein
MAMQTKAFMLITFSKTSFSFQEVNTKWNLSNW